MPSKSFGVLTRGATGISRRNSLLTLGAALAARMSHPEVGAAKKKKKGKDCKTKEQQRCRQDTALCKSLMTTCFAPPEVCEASRACCDECSAHGLLTCLQAI